MWLSRVPRLRLLAIVVASVLISLPALSWAQEIDVYTDSTAQLIRGFGGSFIEFFWPGPTAGEIDTAFGLDEGQLGLSILRLGISPDPDRWSNNLEAAQEAQELGALIFASPWDAPDDLLKPKLNPDDRDTVDVAKYGQYAQHLSDFNTYMKDHGVDLYAISIQNEPDWGYTWTGWTAENMVTFLRDYAPSIGNRIMAPESFQFRKTFTDPILMDSLAAAHADIIAGHIYGGGNESYPLAEEMGKEVWMSEYLLNDQTDDAPGKPWVEWTDEEKWDQTMDMLGTIHQSMKSNMNAYVWWFLRRYYSFVGDGAQGETEGEVTKRGYAFSQFSRFVRPGFVRVHSFGPVGRGYLNVFATAYKDSAGNMVLVAINDEGADKQVSFLFDRLGSATFHRYITSIDQNREQLTDVAAVASTLTVTLPTQTVTTFVSDQATVGTEAGPEIPAGYDLGSNYPNPFSRTTAITYELPESGPVNLTVSDVHGRTVATLVDGHVPAGRHQARFDATGLSSGLYFYTLRAGNVVIRKRMLHVK